MVMFDYIFYRIANFFYKKDGIDAYRAISILSVMQSLVIAEVIVILLRLLFSTKAVANFPLPLPASIIGILVGSFF
jgi:hypothetical protein